MKSQSEEKPEDSLELVGRRKTMRLFHLVAENVPAYRLFLHENRIDHKKVRLWSDFNKLPTINKKNYLQRYQFKDLHWAGKIRKPLIYTSTSGSSGDPVYFTRNQLLDHQYATILKDFIRQGDTKGPILVIIGFAMGIWIGGLITYRAYEIVSNSSDYPLSIIAPGINKSEIVKTLKNLAPHYSQIIIVGYAPFIKEVIDEARAQKVELTSNIRFHFAAEAISERFRDFILSSVRNKNKFGDTINIYGSADIGAMAFEGSVCIMIKKMAQRSRLLYKKIFSYISKTPTLAQYNPSHILFEEQNGELVLTGNNSIPLIRYAIGDHGGVFSYTEMEKILSGRNIDLDLEIKKSSIWRTAHRFPFVYVYERSDFSTTLYGINIYAEMVKEVFYERKIRDYSSGRFNLVTKFDNDHNQYLEINVELQKNIKGDNRKIELISETIHKSLLRKSSEYKELIGEMGRKRLIKLILWPNGHRTYFSPGTKQKWVTK